jgi:hypothetical protein
MRVWLYRQATAMPVSCLLQQGRRTFGAQDGQLCAMRHAARTLDLVDAAQARRDALHRRQQLARALLRWHEVHQLAVCQQRELQSSGAHGQHQGSVRRGSLPRGGCAHQALTVSSAAHKTEHAVAQWCQQ